MKIVIIGNGIAGATAALQLSQSRNHEISMISSETKYPFSRTALMYIYMGHVGYDNTKLYEDNIWIDQNIKLIDDHVTAINTSGKFIQLHTGNVLNYDKLILATGSVPNVLRCEGVQLDGVESLYSIKDLNAIENRSPEIKNAVIIGGGLIGIELAEMLHSRGVHITMLVREDSFWRNVLPQEESEIINQHIRSHGIDLRLSTEVQTIDGSHEVNSITTETGEKIKCEFVGVTVGVSPNISLAQGIDIRYNRGYLINDFFETSHKDIFAIGDCAELTTPREGRRAIESIWYSGKLMGNQIAENINGIPKPYNPGVWYNSAKFLDIEYQVYGFVPSDFKENIQTIYWQNEEMNKSIRIVFEDNSKKVLGFNLLGIRYRHKVCEKWILSGTHIEEVLSNLSLANFDPEFFNQYEQKLIEIYNTKYNKTVYKQSERNLNLVQKFLQKYNQYASV